MATESRKLPGARPGRLGLKGWVYAGRYPVERYLYLLHRITGLGLIFYLLLHIVETGQRLVGPMRWEWLMALFATPVFKALEYVLFSAFVLHGLNGVRLLMTELGFFLGRPAQPIYPYASSIKRHRPLTWGLMLLAGLLVVLGGSSMFFQ
jgi:succinate dehydrogenase / fumarate reductase cytochrome b subunit